MAGQYSLTTFVNRIFVFSILMVISNSIQQLTQDESSCSTTYNCCPGAGNDRPEDNCCTVDDNDNGSSLCTYGTDVVSNNCSNGTLHFFAWFSCIKFIPVVYWKTTNTNGTTCSSKITVQFSGESISLMCYGFLYAQQQNGKLFNITIGEYTISKEGEVALYPASKSSSTCPISTIQPNSTSSPHGTSSYTTTLALTTSTIDIDSNNIVSSKIITSTFVSATSLLGTDSSTSTPPAYNCPMNIQQTEPWVHVVYCVIIVIIILISVIVFLLIFIYQQKNRGHYTFHADANLYNTNRRQNDEIELSTNAEMYAQVHLPYTTPENKRALTRTPSEYLDPVSMRKNKRTTELREFSPTLEQPDMHTYELVVRQQKHEKISEEGDGEEDKDVDRLLKQACKENDDSQQDIDGKDTMELLPHMDPTYDYVQLPWNSQQNTENEGASTTQLSTTEAPDDRASNNCSPTVFLNTDSGAAQTIAREEEDKSNVSEEETKETKEESEKESEFEDDDDDIYLEMAKV